MELDYDKELLDYLTYSKMYVLLKDYIALLVLEKYGGVFIDQDLLCLKPLDELVHRYRYFASFEPYL